MGLKMKLHALLVIAFALVAGCNPLAAQPAATVPISPSEGKRSLEFYNGFEGRWDGDFRRIPSQVFDPKLPNENDSRVLTGISFEISGSSVKVFAKYPNVDWLEVKRGTFHILIGGTNAVIASITAGSDPEGGWVETWNFTVTHKERDSLQVVWTRAVNNFNMPSDFVNKFPDGSTTSGRFFNLWSGEMARSNTGSK
jgi:hypothetical protein